MIAIIDYRMGNLRSVQKGFERVGHRAVITEDVRDLDRADRIVLPGVGAFRDAMAELKRRGWVGPIREAIAAGKPFFGICLGLQLLFDTSFEDGEWEGLGIFSGRVVKFELPAEYKVPHMGWNQVRRRGNSPLLDAIDDDAYFYFVHSYHVDPDDPKLIALESAYHRPFCAAVGRDNVFATQFHPEKSQANGLRLLKRFAEWNGGSRCDSHAGDATCVP